MDYKQNLTKRGLFMYLQIVQKSKTAKLQSPLQTLADNLESERQRLYIVASQCALTSKQVIHQSNIMDRLILEDLKKQLL